MITANFKAILDLAHDGRHARDISRTGDREALYDGLVKGVIENRVHYLLIRRGYAERNSASVVPVTRVGLYEHDITIEHFSHAEHTCTIAE